VLQVIVEVELGAQRLFGERARHLLVGEQRVDTLEGQIELLRDSVDVPVLGHLAQAPADDRGIGDRLAERRVGEQSVDPGRGGPKVAQCLVQRRLRAVDCRARVPQKSVGVRRQPFPDQESILGRTQQVQPSIAAADAGKYRTAEEYLVDAVAVDMADTAGNLRDGLHVALTRHACAGPPTAELATAQATARRIESMVLHACTIRPTTYGDVLQALAAGYGDERWRETVRIIRTSTENRDHDRGPQAGLVAGVGHDLFLALAGLAPELADFLAAKAGRRLVIMSMRPEIHALPWEALSDRRLESVAASDLSIVRCTQVFEPKPYPPPPLVRIYSKFGPDTNDDVLRSARSVRVSNVSGRPVGVEITAQASDAEIVNLVAHGSEKDEHRAQTLVDQDRSLSPEQLAAQYQERLMVLMWSCFSAMVHSWGASPTLALHAAGNVFVLGFVAPLSLKASADIAQKFYDSVFGVAGSQDPERVITEIRAWQFKHQKEFCDWASMTLWLRQPLDLSALPLGTVRVPATAWSTTARCGVR